MPLRKVPGTPEELDKMREDLEYLRLHKIDTLLETALNDLCIKMPRKPIQHLIKVIELLGPEEKPKTPPKLRKMIGNDKMGAWKAVVKAKKEFMAKKSYFVEVANKKVKVKHGRGKHASCMTNHLNEKLYERLKELETETGFTFDKCIKMGIENPNNLVGLVAGDVDSYKVFQELFYPVIKDLHRPNNMSLENSHRSDLNSSWIDEPTELWQDVVLGCRVAASRNFVEIPFPAHCSLEQRRTVESLVVAACSNLTPFLKPPKSAAPPKPATPPPPPKQKKSKKGKKGKKLVVEEPEIRDDLSFKLAQFNRLEEGSYLPLAGSESYEGLEGGMDMGEQKKLQKQQLLFPEPTQVDFMSAGMHRDWPDARGCFLQRAKEGEDGDGSDSGAAVSVWVNERDHLRVVVHGSGASVQRVFARFACVVGGIERALEAEGHGLAHEQDLGYLNSCPAEVGTAMRLILDVRPLPQVEALGTYSQLLQLLGLKILDERDVRQNAATTPKTRSYTHVEGLGRTEVELANIVIRGLSSLISLEKQLSSELYNPRKAPCNVLYGSWYTVQTAKKKALQPSSRLVAKVGQDEVKLEINPEETTGENFHSLDTALTDEMYQTLNLATTPNGVTLDQCIQLGVETLGVKGSMGTGLMAGDEQSYENFKPLFDRVILARHGSKQGLPKHSQSLDVKALKDPSSIEGDYVVECSIHATRNLTGHVFLNACNKDERRKVEQAIAGTLKTLEGPYAMKYKPLHGSNSVPKKQNGIPADMEQDLRDAGILYAKPHTLEMVASGLTRNWPDARGLAFNEDNAIIVWVNRRDHVELISREIGPNIKKAFGRFAKFNKVFEKALDAKGHSFAVNPELGYLSSSVDDLGGCMRAKYVVRMPELGKKDLIKQALKLNIWVEPYQLEEDTYVLMNHCTLGKCEVDLVNELVQGVAKLIKEEQRLGGSKPR